MCYDVVSLPFTVQLFRTVAQCILHTSVHRFLHCLAFMPDQGVQTWVELLRDVHDPNVPLRALKIKTAAYSWAVLHYEETGPSCPAGAGIIRRHYHPHSGLLLDRAARMVILMFGRLYEVCSP